MATLELVEKLKEKANVSYEEAKAALDACGDDLLDAMIYLERQGKVTPPAGGGHYSSQYEQAQAKQQTVNPPKTGPTAGQRFWDMMCRFGRWLGTMFHKGNINQFEVSQNGSRLLSVPVTVLVLLLVFCFWITVPLLIVGLCLGCKYQFRGQDLEKTVVNDVMDSAAKTATTVVDQIKSELDGLQGPK